MQTIPSGTITFLFTDIEGSTALWQRSPEGMRANLVVHDNLLRSAIERNHGYVFKTVGDAFCAAFQVASQGLQAAIEAQQALHAQGWGECVIQVRMGLHTGEADERDRDYFGNTLNRTARLMSAGHGGQTLLSLATQELVRDHLPEGVAIQYLGQHRLKDLIRPEHVYQLVQPGLPHEFAALKTLDYHPNNLPVQATPFIGREADLAALKKLFCDPAVRLVTLSGPGGTGKTRLALQAAVELLEHFPEGVFFVPLAAVDDPDLVPQAIVQALELRDNLGLPSKELIKSLLREKEILLVLDNFEQVVAAAPLVAELLAALPQAKFMITSRILLHVHGEREAPVQPLGLPDLKRLPALEQLTQYEAVRFFIEQAQVARPSFSVTNENAPAVAEICHRLDGLPLALELAAARLRLLTPEKLLAHLGQRLRILSGGARDLPARQQTLRSAIDWSYNLLSHTEQVLFQSLAVFPASFTYEAAEAVCPVPETGNLIELLDQLIEKSLLKLVEEESDLRFVMLETLREYALEKLAEDHGASYSMSQRHLGYFQDWAEALRPQLFQRQMPACLDQIELDYPNLQAALDWALEHDPGTGLRLCSALYKFWSIRIEYRKEGTHWFEKFLAISAAGESPVPQQAADRAWGLLHASRLTFEAGLKNPAREAWLDECVRWSLENSDHACAAEALALRGHSWILSDEASARLVLEQGLAEARLANSDLALGMIYHHLGVLGFYRGDAEESIHQTFETSLALAKKCGDFSIWLHSIYMLGILNAVKGEWQAAIQCHQEGLALAQEIGDPVSTATALSELGNLAMGLGDFEQAQTLLLQAHELLEDTPDDFGFTTVQGTLGELARWQGNYTQAITYLLGMRHKVSDPGSRINYICVLADAERRLNHIEAARRVLLDALDETQKLNQPWIIDTILIPFIAYFSFGLKNYAAAVLLLSWSEHANQSPNRFPSYQREFDEIEAQARAQLDETALASAQQAALELTVEQVLVYAQTLLRTV